MSSAEAIELGEPYPGLRAFRRDETHIFFGREGTISEMVDRLAAHRFLAVTGHSGSGKSSLVRTGLIDALDRGLLVDAGSDWCVADFRPGGQPFSRLTGALVKAVGQPYSDQELGLIEAKLTRGPLGLLGWLDEINFPAETNVLVLVDQFEEIFRYRQGQLGDDADAFVALLLASAKQSKQRNRRVYVVITMRSDFLGDCGSPISPRRSMTASS
jgi:energy-coupling factor transporter ATP-binding protein EcfA2